MARDKSKDNLYSNCSQDSEHEYVAGLYEDGAGVLIFLKAECKENRIHYSTHMEVYKLIEKELNYPVPI